MHIAQIRSGLVGVVREARQDNHLAGIALVRSLNGSAADLERLQDINTGCQMGGGSLHGAQLNASGLAADLLGEAARQIIGCAGELLVSECVNKVNAVCQLAYIPAV